MTINDWHIYDFADLTPWRELKHLDLRNNKMKQYPLLPKSLTHLIVSHNPHLHIKEDDVLPESLPLLETFACHLTFITARFLKVITQKSIEAGNLTRLSIGGRLSTSEEILPVEHEYPASTSLEELNLAGMSIGDERMVRVVALYPKLRKLDASATNVTGVAVREFVNAGVRELKLNECGDVGTDAVEWARGKGVAVEYLFPSRAMLNTRVQRYGNTSFARGF